MNKDKKILKEAEKLAEKATHVRETNFKFNLKPGESSLGKVITTQEKADQFMAMLRALDPNNKAS